MRAVLRRAWRLRTRAPLAVDYDTLALICEQLGAFVSAGLRPLTAWETVARDVGTFDACAVDVIIAWNASVRVGAPVARTCHLLSEGFRSCARIQREIETAVAGPRFARRIMLVLPVFGVLIASALGLDALSFLLGSLAGWACLVVGCGLIVFGWMWSQRLIARIRHDVIPGGVATSVVAAALQAGIGMRDAWAALDAECDAQGAPRLARELPEVHVLATRWGIPVADVLVAVSRADRDRVIGDVRRQAAELGEKLLVPLGACVLPAFVLLAVVPVVAQLLMNTGISWSV